MKHRFLTGILTDKLTPATSDGLTFYSSLPLVTIFALKFKFSDISTSILALVAFYFCN